MLMGRGMGAIIPGCNDTFGNQLISWLKPSCWSAAATQTENAVLYSNYPFIPGNPTINIVSQIPPSVPGSNVPPSSGAEAQATVDQLALTIPAWQVAEAAANPPGPAPEASPSGTNWLLVALVLGGVALMGIVRGR